MYDILNLANTAWSSGKGEQADVVLSSRIRLARNFAQYPFPIKQTPQSAEQVLEQMKQFCRDSGKYQYHLMQDYSALERRVLVEKHLISPEHAGEDNAYRAVALNEEETVSIMINEEDHLRIQCFSPGLNLTELWNQADALDDQIEGVAEYAFDEKYGYLTCCPTNLGNGLRASVMLHLPGLRLTKRLGILNQLNNVGMTVRGLYGEGSEALGDLYQISNQLTLGQSENDILTNLYGVSQQIIKEERNARNYLLEKHRNLLEDKCWRALGILKYARSMDSKEALELISMVRMGCATEIIAPLTVQAASRLYMLAQAGYLQLAGAGKMNETQRDRYRAERIGAFLKES